MEEMYHRLLYMKRSRVKHLKVIRLLLDRGMRLDIPDNYGEVAYQAARRREQREVLFIK